MHIKTTREQLELRNVEELQNEGAQEHFRFPLYHYCNYTEEDIDTLFSTDEKELYACEELFLKGNYQESISRLEKLFDLTKDTYVRYGTIYCLALSYIFLHNYAKACRMFHEINLLYASETLYKQEIRPLILDLETYFVGIRYFLENRYTDQKVSYPNHMEGYMLVGTCFANTINASVNHMPVDPTVFEFICNSQQVKLSPLANMFVHLYTSAICISQNLSERGAGYFLEAVRIAEEYHIEHTMGFFYQYTAETFNRILQDYNPEQLKRIQKYSKISVEAFHGLLYYLEKDEFLQLLRPDDYKFIAYANRGLTHKEIAQELNLSIPSISKKYAVLYEKTGTHSKQELYEMFRKKIEEY